MHRFASDQSGAVTLFHLFWVVVIALVGGMAIDTANAFRVREILQTTAEASALSAAIRAADPQTGETPRMAARAVARTGLSEANLDNAWQADSFGLGAWDAEESRFVRGAVPPDAVQVVLRRESGRNTAQPQLILGLFGIDPWDVKGTAVAQFRTDTPLDCNDPLLSLKLRVDVAQTDIFAGVCLYAQATATYGPDPVWASPAAKSLIDGLLASAFRQPLARTREARAVTSAAALGQMSHTVMSGAALSNTEVIANDTVRVDCSRDAPVTIRNGTVIENAMIIAPCPLRFQGDVTLRSSLVVHNLAALTDPGAVVPATGPIAPKPPCVAGDGVQVLLFADARLRASIPALAPDTGIGAELADRIGQAGGILSQATATAGRQLDRLTPVVNETVNGLDALPVCLDVDTMVTSDTIILRQ